MDSFSTQKFNTRFLFRKSFKVMELGRKWLL